MKPLIRPRARDDILRQFRCYLVEQGPEIAFRFRFENLRLYYLLEAETFTVVRVLHGKRDLRQILETEPGG